MPDSTTHAHIPLEFHRLSEDEMHRRAEAFFAECDTRRSVRFFSDAPVPRALIEHAIRTASTAPSGAHKQPWTFVAVSDPATKKMIREQAEEEEYASYHGRMSDEWLDALAPIGTDWCKPFLETVPWIVVLFAQTYELDADGTKHKNYYVPESCGIAAGFFIAALHHMGLATLTHTPSPMKFLNTILDRPKNERPFILFPIGYPTDDATVPDLKRKPLEAVSVWIEG